MYGTAVAIFVFFINVGSLIALSGGLLLPPPDDPEALRESGMWRVVYGFPLPLYCLITVLLLTVCRYDSPKYLLIQNKREECIKVVQRIYDTEGSLARANEITDFIASTIQ